MKSRYPHYLWWLLLALQLALPDLSLASSFSTYPGQYNTYNRPAEGYKSESTEHGFRDPDVGDEHAAHHHAMPAAGSGQQDSNAPMHEPAAAKAEHAGDGHTGGGSSLKYVCPMHPDEVVRDKPGKCPICGMDLVSFCTTPKMGQGMASVADGTLQVPDLDGETASYVCPMHPEIVSDEPGRCPICGMDLVKKQGHMHAGQHAATPVVSLAPDVVQKMGVRTATVTRGTLGQSYKTVGRIGYNERRVTHVVSHTFGWVDNLSVRTPGTTVQRGQLLLEIYSPEYLGVQQDFLAAHERDKSAGQLKRYGAREETLPSRDFMRYLDVPESAVNELAREGKPRFRLPVYAPQYGVVIRHDVHKHMYLVPGQPMFTIADLSSVWVEVDLFEHQLSWLRRKLKAELQVDALPGQKLQGWVNYIHPELDPWTRTLKVRLLVPNPDGVLRPNMLAEVEIFAEPKADSLKIPREALIETGSSKHVIVDLGAGRFRAVDVVSGVHSNGEVEILSGLDEGDKVVVSGQFLIDSEANLQASFRRFGSHSHH